MVVQVGWIDKVLKKTAGKSKHLDLLKRSNELKKKLEQLDSKREEITRTLAEIDAEFLYNDLVFIKFSISPLKCWINKDDFNLYFLLDE